LGKWVFWVWVWFYPKPIYFHGFSIFRNITTQLPNPTHFFGFFGGVWPGFLGWPNPWTPLIVTYHCLSLSIIIFFSDDLILSLTSLDSHVLTTTSPFSSPLKSHISPNPHHHTSSPPLPSSYLRILTTSRDS